MTFNKVTQRFEIEAVNTCSQCGEIIKTGEIVQAQTWNGIGQDAHIVCPTRKPMAFCSKAGA